MSDYILAILVVCMYFWILNTKEDENIFVKLILNKIKLFMDSICFMILCTDSKGIGPKKNPDPDLVLKRKVIMKKTIIFIRHGESDWNNVFNKGINFSFITRLFKTLFDEFLMFGSINSSFIDSPLNFEGIEQARELSKFIDTETDRISKSDKNHKIIHILSGRNTEQTSVIVSSSLRRSISTTTISLWPRITRTNEKIYILSSLQEISRNIDTYQLSPPNIVADLPFKRITPHCGGDEFVADKVYDTSENFGNKTYNFYGIKRLRAFSEWAIKRSEDTIIVGGHSLWFKSFFQTFLPFNNKHEAKTKKITNSGVISFELYASEDDEGILQYRIDPNSIQTIYGGFTTK